MHEQPEATPEEHEQGPERLQDEEAMRYPGHEDPEAHRQKPDDEDESDR